MSILFIGITTQGYSMKSKTAHEIIEEHYKANYKRLVKMYSYRAGGVQDAEDVVQDAYTRALMYIDNPERIQVFNRWFISILKNALEDHLRHYKRGQPESLPEEEELTPTLCGKERGVFLKEIKKKLKEFDQPTQEVLTLYFLFGYSPRNISKIVELNYKRIQNIIGIYKAGIRKEYGEDICL